MSNTVQHAALTVVLLVAAIDNACGCPRLLDTVPELQRAFQHSISLFKQATEGKQIKPPFILPLLAYLPVELRNKATKILESPSAPPSKRRKLKRGNLTQTKRLGPRPTQVNAHRARASSSQLKEAQPGLPALSLRRLVSLTS